MRCLVFSLVWTFLAFPGFSFPQEVRIDPRTEVRPEPRPDPSHPSGATELDPAKRQEEIERVQCEFMGCPKSPDSNRSHSISGVLDRNSLSNFQVRHPLDPIQINGDKTPQPKPPNFLQFHKGWPRISDLDSKSVLSIVDRAAADFDLEKLNREHPTIRSVRIEYQPENLARYSVYDGQSPPYAGNDLGEIVERLNDQLDQGKSAIAIGFAGFTEKQARAFTTDLSVQQELLHGSRAWLPLASAGAELLGLYRGTGMNLECMILTQVKDEREHLTWWRARMRFTDGNRSFWVQAWLRTRRLFSEFVSTFSKVYSSPTESHWSAEQAVEHTKRQLMSNHPELSEQQIYLEIRKEIRQTQIGELLILGRLAA